MGGPPPPPPPGSARLAPRPTPTPTPIAPPKPQEQQGSDSKQPSQSPTPQLRADNYGQTKASPSPNPAPRASRTKKRRPDELRAKQESQTREAQGPAVPQSSAASSGPPGASSASPVVDARKVEQNCRLIQDVLSGSGSKLPQAERSQLLATYLTGGQSPAETAQLVSRLSQEQLRAASKALRPEHREQVLAALEKTDQLTLSKAAASWDPRDKQSIERLHRAKASVPEWLARHVSAQGAQSPSADPFAPTTSLAHDALRAFGSYAKGVGKAMVGAGKAAVGLGQEAVEGAKIAWSDPGLARELVTEEARSKAQAAREGVRIAAEDPRLAADLLAGEGKARLEQASSKLEQAKQDELLEGLGKVVGDVALEIASQRVMGRIFGRSDGKVEVSGKKKPGSGTPPASGKGASGPSSSPPASSGSGSSPSPSPSGTKAAGTTPAKTSPGASFTVEEVVAPSTSKPIRCASGGSTLVPLDKIDIYGSGKVAPFPKAEMDALKDLKQTNRKEFDRNPENQKRLDALGKWKHRYERSVAMADEMRKAGLDPDSATDRNKIIDHLLKAGEAVDSTNRHKFVSEIDTPTGRLKIFSTWTILPDGRKYLATLEYAARPAKGAVP